jgi:hypothetical protein
MGLAAVQATCRFVCCSASGSPERLADNSEYGMNAERLFHTEYTVMLATAFRDVLLIAVGSLHTLLSRHNNIAGIQQPANGWAMACHSYCV